MDNVTMQARIRSLEDRVVLDNIILEQTKTQLDGLRDQNIELKRRVQERQDTVMTLTKEKEQLNCENIRLTKENKTLQCDKIILNNEKGSLEYDNNRLFEAKQNLLKTLNAKESNGGGGEQESELVLKLQKEVKDLKAKEVSIISFQTFHSNPFPNYHTT